jgi:archaellum component FlaC
MATNNWATLQPNQKESLKNMGDWIDLEGNTHTGINSAEDFFKYIQKQQSDINLEGTKPSSKPSTQYNVVSSGAKVYTSDGLNTVAISKTNRIGYKEIPLLINDAGEEITGAALDVIPVSYQTKDDFIGLNVKTSTQDQSAEYQLIDNEMSQLENRYNSATTKLQKLGWKKGNKVSDFDNQTLQKSNAGYSLTDNAELESHIALMETFENDFKELNSKRESLRGAYTTTAFIPLYSIKDNKYLDSHTIFDDTYTNRAIDLLKNYQTENQDTEWDANDY